MALSGEQTNVARKIIAQGRQMNAPRHVIRVALAAALTESGLRNLHYGDAATVGPFQERTSQGWGSPEQLARVRYQAKQFYNRAIPLFNQGTRGGHLAQAVERSAYPSRYQPNLGEAGAILRGLSRQGLIPQEQTVTKQGPPSVAAQAQTTTRTVQPVSMLPNPLPTTVATAGPTFPTQRPGEVDRRKRAAQTQIGPLSTQGNVSKEITTTTTTPAPIVTKRVVTQGSANGLGRIEFSDTADRPGVKTQRGIRLFARQVAALAGRPLLIGTGTNHSQMTVSGNVSDHWSGNAVDIPAAGPELIKLGQKALIAAGMSPAEAKSKTGGLFNVGGHQIIFNTMEGGDHTNHLHISADPGYAPRGGGGRRRVVGRSVKQPKPRTQRTVRLVNNVYTQTPPFSNRPTVNDLTSSGTPYAPTSSGLEGKVRRLLR